MLPRAISTSHFCNPIKARLMLFKSFASRVVALHLTTSFRTFALSTSMMAQAPGSFTLDRSIFNETLYSRMRDFWFHGLPDSATTPTEELLDRWYGPEKTVEEKADFDKECAGEFGHALDALKPDKVALPAFKSSDDDIANAEYIAGPLLSEVKEAQAQDEKKGTDTLLSLVLILDQISRNVYRDPQGLRLVFGHFDRLALTLVHASMKLSPKPVDFKPYQLRPVILQWYLMPLMHAEHLPSHEMFMKIMTNLRNRLKEAGDQPAVDNVDRSINYEEAHVKPIRKFGRYPHRNAALGRTSSAEEEEELKSGETFGVQQVQKEEEEEWKKSEL